LIGIGNHHEEPFFPITCRGCRRGHRQSRLEVEVTNLSANRIRDLDQRKVPWKNFHDINYVNIRYKPFDASDWPLYDSGLLGPVTLTAIAPKPTVMTE